MSGKRPGYEEERAHYEARLADRRIEREATKMRKKYEARMHPCNQDPCVCTCIKCVQARKYNQPKTHCRGR
jgi:hypothetical protein